MKSLRIAQILLPFTCLLSPIISPAAKLPTTAAPWLELRKAPLFEAKTQELADTWGPSVPNGDGFEIEKSYGRWIFGKPQPLERMLEKDYAPKGWVYNRMLLPPDDSSTRSREAERLIFLGEYYAKSTWKDINVPANQGHALYLSFLNNLVLSENTLAAFIKLDEAATVSAPSPSFWQKIVGLFNTNAYAGKKPLQLNFSGVNLNFLRDEATYLARKRAANRKIVEDRRLKPPILERANDWMKEYVLGQYVAIKTLDLPSLTQEEVDGHLYLRAVITRALRSCPDAVQDYWRNRPWSAYRMKNIFGRPTGENLWVVLEMPGSQFFYSDQVFRAAENEAELAFVLIRSLIMSMKWEKIPWKFNTLWEQDIPKLTGSAFIQIRNQQSVKLSPSLDVADEFSADLFATQCIANAGYLYHAGLSYLAKLRAAREASWTSWHRESSIGMDYRLERLAREIAKGLGDGSIKNMQTTNPLRFHAASKLWNL